MAAETMDPVSQETIWIRGEGGGVFEMGLPLHDTIVKQLASGISTRVNEDGTPYVTRVDTEQLPPADTEQPARPAK